MNLSDYLYAMAIGIGIMFAILFAVSQVAMFYDDMVTTHECLSNGGEYNNRYWKTCTFYDVGYYDSIGCRGGGGSWACGFNVTYAWPTLKEAMNNIGK